MNLDLNVTGISPNEFPRVLEVYETSVRATHHFVAGTDIDLFLPLVRDALPRTPRLGAVRDTSGCIMGFIAVVGDEVDMLFVHPDAFGHGAGKALMRHAMDRWGARRVDVNEQNTGAFGFYRRLGFEVIGRSERDGLGKPYPLLHLRLTGDA